MADPVLDEATLDAIRADAEFNAEHPDGGDRDSRTRTIGRETVALVDEVRRLRALVERADSFHLGDVVVDSFSLDAAGAKRRWRAFDFSTGEAIEMRPSKTGGREPMVWESRDEAFAAVEAWRASRRGDRG